MIKCDECGRMTRIDRLRWFPDGMVPKINMKRNKPICLNCRPLPPSKRKPRL